MDIVTYVLAKKAGGSAEEAKELAEQALRETAALDERLTADEEIIDSIKNGLQYKGAVDYYKDLPADYTEAEVGYCYTVKYKGESGTQPSGKEYVWGSSDGMLQWIELGGLLEDYIKFITYDAETNSLEITDQDDNVITFSAATHQEVLDEKARAQEIESDLLAAVQTEITRAKEAEGLVNTKVDNEITRATEAEGALNQAIGQAAADITAEATRAQEAEGALDTKIEAETTRATGKEADLETAIGNEATARANADTALGGRIDAADAAIIQEATDRAEAIATEVTDRNNAILVAINGEVQARDSAISNAIAVEVANRNTAIEEAVAAETERATTAEEGLTQAIADEEARAEEAEGSLSDRIAVIEDDYLTSADKTELQGNIDTVQGNVEAETTRAEEAESGLSDRIGTIENAYVVSVNGNSGVITGIATEQYVDDAIEALPEPMIFKGSVGEGGTVEWDNLPEPSAANEGFTYKVITKHTTAPICEVDDTIISNGIEWVVIPSGDEPSGTVTSVDVSVPTGLTSTGGPITSSGTIAINLDTGYTIPTEARLSGIEDDIDNIEQDIANIKDGTSIDSFGDVEAAVADLQEQIDAEVEIIAYQAQTPLTAEQIEKAQNGKLAIFNNGKLYIESFKNNDIVNFSHFTIAHNNSSSQNVNDILISKEYVIILDLETGLLSDTGYMPVDAIGDYANNFFDAATAPTETGKKLVREQNLYKTNQEVATKQDIIDENNKLNSDYIDEYTTEDDIQSLFPEKVETIEAFETALTSADKYLELEADMTKAQAFDIVGAQKTIDLNGNTIESTGSNALRLNQGAELVIEGDGNVNSQEFGVLALHGSSATINGGTFTTTDNIVLGTNGLSGYGENTIVVNDGTFNAHITSNGYIACGVYVANNDTVVLNGGTFNIYDGCGVCVRSGQAIIGEDVVFNMLTEHIPALTAGKVGDAPIQVPAGERFVLDLKANYPGGKPSIVLNGILYDENNIEAAREAGIIVLEA